jgi:hypothetical protein
MKTKRNLLMLLSLVPVLVFSWSCTSPRSSDQYSLSSPVAMALVCQKASGGAYVPAPLADCDDTTAHRLLAAVANGSTGDVGFIDLTGGDAIDTDPVIPGFTRLDVGTSLTDIRSRPDSTLLFALDSAESALVVIDPVTLEFEPHPLPYPPSRLLLLDDGNVALVSFPSAGKVCRFVLDEAGKPWVPDCRALGGEPSSMAAGGSVVVVSHLHAPVLNVLALDTLDPVGVVGMVPACADQVDNDQDGLVDGEDPGCLDRSDSDETDPVPCVEAEGSECPPVVLAECGNGLDDDNDGLVDLADPGCRDRLDGTEVTDTFLADAKDPVSGFVTLPCADGIDNDLDGRIDFPADPDCFSAGSSDEQGLPPPLTEIAVDADGKLAYAAHRGAGAVMVVDLETLAVVQPGADEGSYVATLDAFAGRMGIPISGGPVDVVFSPGEDSLSAYAVDGAGRLSKILVSDKDGAIHRVEEYDEDTAPTSAGKPHLYVDGAEVQLGLSPAVGYPNLGPLMVETLDGAEGAKRYYGVEFSTDERAHRSETWTVAWEGILPGSSRLMLRVTGADRVVTVGGSLCALGVLPGDILVVTPPAKPECGKFEVDVAYNYPIKAVGGDWIELETDAGWFLPPSEDVVAATGSSSAVPEEEPLAEKAPTLTAECFPDLLDLEVRGAGAFVVYGSSTGYLHNVVEGPDGCIENPAGDLLFAGRVLPATMPEDQPLETCPVTEPVDGMVLAPYENPILSFNVYPGCRMTAEGEIEIVPPERGTVWRFAVDSGFSPRRLQVGSMPVDMTLSPVQDRLYVLDLAARSIRAVDTAQFVLLSAYY